MPLSEKILKQIADKCSDLHVLVLDGKDGLSIQDEDIPLLLEKLSKDSHINSIRIRHHNLTVKSYPSLLDLVRDHPNITSFHCDLIKPVTLTTSIYNGAIRKILFGRQQATTAAEESVFEKPLDIEKY